LLAVGAIPFAAAVAMIPADGGFAPAVWLPVGLGVLALLALSLRSALVSGIGAPRAAIVAVLAIAAFAAWSAASIAWADQPAIAWEGANRALLYAAVFALYALVRWSRNQAAALLGAYVVGVAAAGLWSVLRTVDPGDPTRAFDAGRLAVPIPYSNANAALFLAALWPALGLAARRATPPIARGAMYAAAGLFLELAVLSQSRAALGAVPIAAATMLLASPSRVRLVVAGVLVTGVVVLLGVGLGLVDVYEAIVNERDAAGAIGDARQAIVASVVCLFGIGAAVAAVDRSRVVAGPPQRLLAGIVAVTAAVAVGLGLVSLVRGGDPRDRVSQAWEQFRTNERDDYAGPYLTSGLGSNRYDLWRVALGQFTAHPLQGIGADNFGAVYLEERRTDERPLYPHSLPLRVLSQTGVVGAALVVVWLVAAYSLVFRGRRTRSQDAWLLAVSGSMTALYWITHGAVDWLWEIPALGVPAVAALGLAARIEDDGNGVVQHAPTLRPPAWVVVATGAAVAAAATSFATQWVLVRPERSLEQAVDPRAPSAHSPSAMVHRRAAGGLAAPAETACLRGIARPRVLD
jgi:hypothetical protein